MHICFYTRDEVDFDAFIRDLEGEAAHRGMTQVKASRMVTVTTEEQRQSAPLAANTNKFTEGKSNGWVLIYSEARRASSWNSSRRSVR